MLGHRPAPLSKRTDPQILVMLGPNQVPAKIEEIGNSSMITQKTLRCFSDLNFHIPCALTRVASQARPTLASSAQKTPYQSSTYCQPARVFPYPLAQHTAYLARSHQEIPLLFFRLLTAFRSV